MHAWNGDATEEAADHRDSVGGLPSPILTFPFEGKASMLRWLDALRGAVTAVRH